MKRATGAKSSITFAQEAVWKTTPSSPDEVYGLNIRSSSLGGSKNQFQSETINQFRTVVGLGDGNKSVEGNIVTDLLPEGLEVLFRHLLGKGNITTTGSGPYTHVLKGSAETLEGLTIVKGFTNINEYFVYPGCRVNSMNINFIQEGFHDITWEFIGTAEEIEAVDPFTGETPIYPTKSGFTGYQAKIDVDTGDGYKTLGYVTSGNLSITNNVETDGFVLGSDTRASAEYGRRESTGAFNMFFSDTDLYKYFLSGKHCSLKWIVSNTATGDSMIFEFPKCKLGGSSPSIDDASGVELAMTFQSEYDEVQETDVILTLVNGTTAIKEQPTP